MTERADTIASATALLDAFAPMPFRLMQNPPTAREIIPTPDGGYDEIVLWPHASARCHVPPEPE